MRNLIFFLLLLTALPASSQVVAGNYTPGFYSSVNYVKNPSCILNDANITDASGIVSRTTASPITEGLKASCLIDGTASAQVVKFVMNSFDTDLDGDNCEAMISFKGDASKYKIYVESPVSTKITPDFQLSDTGSLSRTEKISFPCGVRATAKVLVVETTDSAAAAIKVGNVYGGKNTSVSSTQLISETTSWSPNAVALSSGSITNKTSTGKYSRNGDRAKVSTMTVFSAASAAFDGFRMSLPPGCKLDTAKIANDAVFSKALGYATLHDGGVSAYAVAGKVAPISGDVDNVSVVWSTTNFAQSAITNTSPFTFAAGDSVSTDFEVPCQGWTAQTLVMPDAQGWYVDASISGANVGLGTTSVSSYSPIGSSSLTMTKASGSADVMVPCSGGNAPSGLTCSAGSELFGAAFNIPKSGAYRVCLAANHYIDSPVGSINVVSTFQLVETSTTSDTILQEGKGKAMSGSVAMSGDRREYRSIYTCGDFVFSSVGQKVVKLMYETEISGTPDNHYIKADGDTVLGQPDVHITVYPLQDRATAILANSVSTTVTNGVKINSATISDAGVVYSETGDWINGSCAITDTSLFTCTLNSGIFSSAPSCSATRVSGDWVDRAITIGFTSMSQTSVVARTGYTDSATNYAKVAYGFSLICVGPR